MGWGEKGYRVKVNRAACGPKFGPMVGLPNIGNNRVMSTVWAGCAINQLQHNAGGGGQRYLFGRLGLSVGMSENSPGHYRIEVNIMFRGYDQGM